MYLGRAVTRWTRALCPFAKGMAVAAVFGVAAIGCETDTGASESSAAESRAEARAPVRADATSTSEQRETGTGEVDLRLARGDIESLHGDLKGSIAASEVVSRWRKASEGGDRPLVAILPIRNGVGGSISVSVTALTSRLETYFVNDVPAGVASSSAHLGTFEEALDNHANRREALLAFGREVGIDYVVDGRLSSDRPLEPDTVRIRYTVGLRIFDVSNGDVVFETEARLRKGPPK